ncbi:hypothetical protein P8452_76359 [Trifolium repens]|nr:hypothetical protein P8452_76359 [Trifolium repens]
MLVTGFEPIIIHYLSNLLSTLSLLLHTSAVSCLTVKETSKVGARPEKPIEIYEFERILKIQLELTC